MLFVKTSDLKEGMRLAKPIFSRNGTLLYERNSKLTKSAIPGIANFGLSGLFILEPAEPLPPLTQEEIEYERFQAVYVFQLQEDFLSMEKGNAPKNLHNMVSSILQDYGSLKKRINFVQNLRSNSDFTYKHCLNTAILCAMLAHELPLDAEQQKNLVYSALLHDLGTVLTVPPVSMPQGMDAKLSKEYKQDDPNYIYVERYKKRMAGFYLLQDKAEEFAIPESALQIVQLHNQPLFHPNLLEQPVSAGSWNLEEKTLHVANTFDMMTCMSEHTEPTSFLAAIRYLKKNRDYYDPSVVLMLSRCLKILPPGACVDLSNGKKGLVIHENFMDFETPVILNFETMELVDLRDKKKNASVYITDNMRTMDNRIQIDEETLKQFNADQPLIDATEKIRRKLQAGRSQKPAK